MKLRILFNELGDEPINAVDTQIIVIQSPYKVIQKTVGETRRYEVKEGLNLTKNFNYEQYCAESLQMIQHALEIFSPVHSNYEEISIEEFNQPPTFQAVCKELEKLPLQFNSPLKIVFKNCSFGGALYTNSAKQLLNFIKHKISDPLFKISYQIIDTESLLSKHDQARFAVLQGITNYNNDVPVKTFIDDSLVGLKKNSLFSKISAPSFYYQDETNNFQNQTPAERILQSFFSQEHQQQSDYSCGPATIKMVASYFHSIRQFFCNAPVEHKRVWTEIVTAPEMIISEKLRTTEAEGSDIPDMRQGLMEMGITVFDDNGLSIHDCQQTELQNHKSVLWDKLHQIIKLGIPVILNMHNSNGYGHFEVVIGIDDHQEKESIIFAEPAMALFADVKFERIEKDVFIERWQNGNKEFHGRFLILSPNSATTQTLAAILDDIPHNLNAERVNHTPFYDLSI